MLRILGSLIAPAAMLRQCQAGSHMQRLEDQHP